MEVSIAQPLGFTQLGSRTNNEDTLFPDPKVTTPQQRWFMVCDGVGGAERGEVASQLAAIEFDQYFRENPVTTVTDAYIQEALSFVQDRFDEYVAENPQAENMGTTLTLVYRHDGGITVAHLGDSRVYLIRKGVIEWRTDDHSYVNELVKAGVLNPDEARRHPQRNIITRAIQSGEKRAKAEVQLLNDLEPGDYLFMCTDGILERISDELLEKTLGGSDSNEEKMETLLACCKGQTRDNFTACLLQIATVTGKVTPSARVKLPTYSRPYSDDDDDAVTLIGVPRPDALPSYAGLTEQNAVPPRREPVRPPVDMRPPVEAKPPLAQKPVASPPSGGSRWLPWALVIVLLGGGCFALWYKYGDLLQKESTQEEGQAPSKKITSSMASAMPTAQTIDTVKTNSTEAQPSTPVQEETAHSEEPMETEKNKTVILVSKPGIGLEVTKDKNEQRGLKWIASRENGKEIFRPQFSKIHIEQYNKGLMPADIDIKGHKKLVYISVRGEIYEKIGNFSKNPDCKLVPVQKDDVWLYLNFDGYKKLKTQYKKASAFDEKTCTAKVTDLNGRTFLIDSQGKEVETKEGEQK